LTLASGSDLRRFTGFRPQLAPIFGFRWHWCGFSVAVVTHGEQVDEWAVVQAVDSWMRRRGGAQAWAELERPGYSLKADASS
jgi:hypothetical protein